MIERKIELITFISASLVVSGLLKSYIFFKVFNVNVLPFIEVDEILVYSFDSLLFFFFFGSYMAVVIYLLYGDGIMKNTDFLAMNWRERMVCYKMLSRSKFVLFAVSIICGGIFNYVIRPNPNTSEFIYWIVIFGISIYFVPIMFCEADRSLKRRGTTNAVLGLGIIFSCFLLLVCSVLLAFNDAHKVQYENFYEGSYVVVRKEEGLPEDQKITSTRDYLFIGMTGSYVFFYDKAESRTDVIPRSNILKMSIK